MKSLLIIGAGGHGQVVAETAAACGYEKMVFLDDSPDAVKTDELEELAECYDGAIVSIGNGVIRARTDSSNPAYRRTTGQPYTSESLYSAECNG